MKQRLDMLLVEQGLAPSRNVAQAMVMAGEVSVDGQVLTKAGHLVLAEAEIKVAERSRYVSRGGDKLASVVGALALDFAGKTVLDVGSSTGGFTDFALQNGAAKVYCVDVGNAQLAYKLRQDSRVVLMERTDIRAAELSEKADIAVIDVSFISLIKILRSVAELVKADGKIVAMMKPQFEAGKTVADEHKGLILDEAVRQQVISDFREAIETQFAVEAEADSGVPGLHGNRERFFVLRPLAANMA